jgi:Cysteine-rich CPCC
MSKYACPCCAYLTMHSPERGTFGWCEVCWWEDDDEQYDDPDTPRGANTPVSLNQARANFARIGSSDPRWVNKVRPPLPSEIPKSN